mmetsp:Transcript_22612/g.70765  ORF Transcript_22612/g.70765 Transcript_22612/m.70765 type:complete len:333 (-) Transcript_22612:2538-3536(-)
MESTSRRARRKGKTRYSEEDGILYHHSRNDETARMVLPTALRDRVIKFYHTSPLYGHASGRVTHQNIREVYWFSWAQHSVEEWVFKDCLICMKSRAKWHPRMGLLQQVGAGGDLQLLGIDLVGELQGPLGKFWIVVYYDPFSHFLVLDVVDSRNETGILESFVTKIILEGRQPREIVTDNASELTGRVIRQLLRLLKVRYRTTIPYTPQGNPTERVNSYIMGMLRTLIHSPLRTVHDLQAFVRIVPFVYNRMFIPGTKISPFMLRTGRQPLTPMDVQTFQHIPHVPREKVEFAQDLVERIRATVKWLRWLRRSPPCTRSTTTTRHGCMWSSR